MTTQTDRLRLKSHTTADAFSTAEWAENWGLLDAHPGIFICTSGTRPAGWGAAHEGMHIFETDTELVWEWDGAAFQRLTPVGLLGQAEVNADVTNGTTDYAVGVQVNVDVAAGGRQVLVGVSGPGVTCDQGLTALAIYRDATLLQEWESQGGGGAAVEQRPRPLHMSLPDGPAAGNYDYSLQFSAVLGFGGTATLQAEADKPLVIWVIEV